MPCVVALGQSTCWSRNLWKPRERGNHDWLLRFKYVGFLGELCRRCGSHEVLQMTPKHLPKVWKITKARKPLLLQENGLNPRCTFAAQQDSSVICVLGQVHGVLLRQPRDAMVRCFRRQLSCLTSEGDKLKATAHGREWTREAFLVQQ